MALACFKDGSDEIVGMNANFVKCKDDTFMKEIYPQVNMEGKFRLNLFLKMIITVFQIKSEKIRLFADLMGLLRENFNIFEVYSFDKHLSSIGLVVDKTYRRRGIAEQLLRCRKAICNEFGIRLTSTVFTSNSSNRIADKIGFQLDVIIR